MGFSVSASTIVIFIALVLSAGAVYTTWDYSQDQIISAYQNEKTDLLNKKSTEILIKNTTYNSSTDTYSVEVKNIGETTLIVNYTDLLTDGAIRTSLNYSIINSSTTSYWLPGETLIINTSLTQEPNRTKVITSNGLTKTLIK